MRDESAFRQPAIDRWNHTLELAGCQARVAQISEQVEPVRWTIGEPALIDWVSDLDILKRTSINITHRFEFKPQSIHVRQWQVRP